MPPTPNQTEKSAAVITDKIPTKEKLIYGAAGITDLWSAYTINRLQLPIFTVALGLSPTLVGVIFVIFRVWDGLSDPLFGWLSDNTRTRWGRRRPFLLIGGLLIGVTLPLVYLVHKDWSQSAMIAWILVTGLLLYTAHSCWNVPYQSLMLEMTPDTTERTNLSAVRGYFQQSAGIVGGMIWYFITLPVFVNEAGQPDTLFGARVVVTVLAVCSMVLGILPAFFLRERYYKVAVRQQKTSIIANFKHAFKNRSFRLLSYFVVLYSTGAGIASTLFTFSRFYYVTPGNEVLAAKITALDGIISTIAAVAGVPLAQLCANRLGKSVALTASAVLTVVGSLLTFVTFLPSAPYLSVISNPILALASGAVWVVIPSITGDIVDDDELTNGERREGTFASIFSWLVKMTFSVGAVLPGVLIELGGFNEKLGSHQTAASLLNLRLILALAPTLVVLPAVFILARYTLTGSRMKEIRLELEARRGTL